MRLSWNRQGRKANVSLTASAADDGSSLLITSRALSLEDRYTCLLHVRACYNIVTASASLTNTVDPPRTAYCSPCAGAVRDSTSPSRPSG